MVTPGLNMILDTRYSCFDHRTKSSGQTYSSKATSTMVVCITEEDAHYTCSCRHSTVCLEDHSPDHRRLSCVLAVQTAFTQQRSHL
eukprot:2603090-Prorocentrum_lima.AAC.1